MSEMLSADQAFLTQQEYLKIIQQCEQSNFTDKELVDLLLWSQDTIMRYEMLCQFFDNNVEISKIENGEPLFSLTNNGIEKINTTLDEDE